MTEITEKAIFNAIAGLDEELLYDARVHRRRNKKRLLGLAAAAVFLIAASVTAFVYAAVFMPLSTVELELDGKICLRLNQSRSVVSSELDTRYLSVRIPAVNGKPADKAVGDTVAALLGQGRLSAVSNTLILGVDGDDSVLESVKNAARQSFSQSGVSGCVISFSFNADSELNAFADDNSISRAKAYLISALSELRPEYSLKRLKKLSVNDLGLLLGEPGNLPDGVSVSGVTSVSGYISKEEASQIALSLSNNGSNSTGCRLELGDNGLVYRVVTKTGEKGTAYVINAVSGEIENVVNSGYSGSGETYYSQRTRPSVQNAGVYQPPRSSQTAVSSAGSAEGQKASSPAVTEPIAETSTEAAEADETPPTNRTDELQSQPSTAEAPVLPLSAVSLDAEYGYYGVAADMRQAGFVAQAVPESATVLEIERIFDGKFIQPLESVQSENFISGETTVICNPSQLQSFLEKYSSVYTDNSSNTFTPPGAEFFEGKILIASAFELNNLYYDFGITQARADSSSLYVDISMSLSGSAPARGYTMRSLCVYSVDKALIKNGMTLVLY